MSKTIGALTPQSADEALAAIVAGSGDTRPALQALTTRVGTASTSASGDWSLTRAAVVYAAAIAHVYGDTRSAEGKEAYVESVSDFGKRLPTMAGRPASTSYLGQLRTAGHALSLGATRADVLGYLAEPGKHAVAVLADRFGRGDATSAAFMAARVEGDRMREVKKAARVAEREAEREVKEAAQREQASAVKVAADPITLATGIITAMTVEDVTSYLAAHGADVVSEYVDAIREHADTVAAILAARRAEDRAARPRAPRRTAASKRAAA